MLPNKAFLFVILVLPNFPNFQLHIINTVGNLLEFKRFHIQLTDSELIGVIIRIIRLENKGQLSAISFMDHLTVKIIIRKKIKLEVIIPSYIIRIVISRICSIGCWRWLV